MGSRTWDIEPWVRELLVALGRDEPGGVISAALSFLVDALEVRAGYAAIGPGIETRNPRWHTAHGLDPDLVSTIRDRNSTTIMSAALREQAVVLTTDALVDARFEGQESVRRRAVRALMCGALRRSDGTPIGLIYLEAPRSGLFQDADVARFEAMLSWLGPVAARVADVHRLHGEDATREIRRKIPAPGLVGRSPAIAEVLRHVAACADVNVKVLLTGPTGSGKTTVARLIHEHSGRRGRFVEVNCSNLKSEMGAVQLFGAVPGFVNGMKDGVEGHVEDARSGTLFLDEVAELPPMVQADLLKFLDSGTWRRMGESRVREARDTRVIAATNVDLHEAVAERRFREDTLARFKFRIHMPALMERMEDLPLLAHKLPVRIAEAANIEPLPLSDDAMAWIETQSWPRNVRGLEAAITCGLIWARAEQSSMVHAHHLQRDLPTTTPRSLGLNEAVQRFKHGYVKRTVDACEGNVSEAAERLGVSRNTIYKALQDGPGGASTPP